MNGMPPRVVGFSIVHSPVLGTVGIIIVTTGWTPSLLLVTQVGAAMILRDKIAFVIPERV